MSIYMSATFKKVYFDYTGIDKSSQLNYYFIKNSWDRKKKTMFKSVVNSAYNILFNIDNKNVKLKISNMLSNLWNKILKCCLSIPVNQQNSKYTFSLNVISWFQNKKGGQLD